MRRSFNSRESSISMGTGSDPDSRDISILWDRTSTGGNSTYESSSEDPVHDPKARLTKLSYFSTIDDFRNFGTFPDARIRTKGMDAWAAKQKEEREDLCNEVELQHAI